MKNQQEDLKDRTKRRSCGCDAGGARSAAKVKDKNKDENTTESSSSTIATLRTSLESCNTDDALTETVLRELGGHVR